MRAGLLRTALLAMTDMRPEILNPLFTEVEALKGVGPQVARLLKKLGIERVVDLLYHLPTGAIERIKAPAANSVAARPQRDPRADSVRQPRKPLRARAERGSMRPMATATRSASSISTIPAGRSASLPKGEKRIVSGKLEAYGDEWQIIHPEVAEPGKGPAPQLREPVYPLTEGLTNRRLGELVREALERAPDLAEWIEPSLLARESWAAGARRWRSSIASPARTRRGGGSPTTRFSPTSSRCFCSASRSGATGRRRLPGTGELMRKLRSALRAYRRAAAGDPRRSAATWRRWCRCSACSRATSARARRWSRSPRC